MKTPSHKHVNATTSIPTTTITPTTTININITTATTTAAAATQQGSVSWYVRGKAHEAPSSNRTTFHPKIRPKRLPSAAPGSSKLHNQRRRVSAEQKSIDCQERLELFLADVDLSICSNVQVGMVERQKSRIDHNLDIIAVVDQLFHGGDVSRTADTQVGDD
ncbi:hypothetical protein CH063_09155 [Colletotrichum higginsianum]|uniref:Uncharacterized protein n=1 Tax=Colletotrichum higginsianum (strain IMI 349063) TaxID=759273 RepID=H1VCI5_COLHI|nr:hypothetical protein CH063_09155 [Colletotrichum higginsianum]